MNIHKEKLHQNVWFSKKPESNEVIEIPHLDCLWDSRHSPWLPGELALEDKMQQKRQPKEFSPAITCLSGSAVEIQGLERIKLGYCWSGQQPQFRVPTNNFLACCFFSFSEKVKAATFNRELPNNYRKTVTHNSQWIQKKIVFCKWLLMEKSKKM